LGKGISEHFSEFTSAAQDYVETTIKYQKLDLYKKGLRTGISLGYGLVLLIIGLIALLFLSVALSIFLGRLLDDLALGYLIVGVVYVIIMLIVANTIKPKIEKAVLRKTSASMFGLTADREIKETTDESIQ
jgi:hypothetical protein